MGRARREKKSKTNLKIWVPIICIVVVAITFYLIHNMQNKIEENGIQNTTDMDECVQDVENELIEENIAEENIVIENDEPNEITNTEENTSSKNTTSSTNSQSSTPAQPGVTDKKQKAIELVKKEWGEDDTVSYVFDYVNENGEYVIAVKDRSSATVRNYFRVNLETETVELD